MIRRLGVTLAVLGMVGSGSWGLEPVEDAFAARPALSPDGTRIAYLGHLQGREHGELFVADADGRNARQLTSTFEYIKGPDWSADGQRIVFGGKREGTYDVYVVDADGTDLRRLTSFPFDAFEPAFSPDDKKIIYNARPGEFFQMHILDLASGEHSVFHAPDYHVVNPDWSNDGRIVFSSEKNGLNDLFVIDEDGSNLQQVTFHPGAETGPSWSPDGTKIAFHANWADPRLRWGGIWDIYVLDPETWELERVTSDADQELFPNWGSDEGTLIYSWHFQREGQDRGVVFVATKVGGSWGFRKVLFTD